MLRHPNKDPKCRIIGAEMTVFDKGDYLLFSQKAIYRFIT